MPGMRRLFSLSLLAGLAWWFLGRRREPEHQGATIGYADGSSVTLAAGSPELERLQTIAAQATAS